MIHCLLRMTSIMLLSLVSVLASAPESSPGNLAAPSSTNRTPRQPQDSVATSVPILVTDFELFASPVVALPKTPTTAQGRKPQATSATNDAPSVVLDDTDSPAVQARQLMDFFSTTLVQSLEKSGYKAVRRPTSSGGGTAGSAKGVLLRGVFAEPDSVNRIRRAMRGAGAPGAKYLLYVGTFNLSRPDQPLYQVAAVQSPDNRYGPVITPNAYIPLVKYEIPKNPTDEDVRKVCDDIVRNLTVLLNANASAFAQ